MSKVFFKLINSYDNTEEINKASVMLLKRLILEENITLNSSIPLKTHFGEKGNKTYIESKNYNGIIDFFKSKDIKCRFAETSVLYKGERMTKEKHLRLAADHGFTQIPVDIVDGQDGNEYILVEINKKNFKQCKIAKGIAESNQIVVLSHFKGHALAGFGGAIKQLAMGCASRGGKLDQHSNSKPKISSFKCKSCKACAVKCPEQAITVEKKAKINHDMCVGCAACIAICPHNAISNSWIQSLFSSFSERLAEYALAAQQGKNNIYITFAFNITRGCDCEGHNMKPVIDDIGIFASLDPVAIDKACLDMADKLNNRMVFKRGRKTLEYAEKIGLGTQNYELTEL
jgi:uncharacterized Fe-S center protein